MTNRQRGVIALGLIISVVCMALALQGLKPVEVIASIGQANGWLLLAAAAWYLASRIVIALRWWFLLRSTQHIPVLRLLELVCIGYMGNNVYPLRAGEILRVLLLKREFGVPIVRTTTVILAERVFDGIVLLSFVLLTALTLDIGSPEVQTVISLAAPIFGAALLVFFALALNPALFRRLVRGITERLPDAIGGKLAGMADHVIDGLGGLRTPGDLLGTIVTSYGTWLLEAVTFWLVAQAFGLEIGYLSLLLVVGVVNLAGLIPASPGQFGVFEGVVRATFASLGIASAIAIPYGLTVHMVIWLPVTVIGFILLARKGIGLKALTDAGQAMRREEALT